MNGQFISSVHNKYDSIYVDGGIPTWSFHRRMCKLASRRVVFCNIDQRHFNQLSDVYPRNKVESSTFSTMWSHHMTFMHDIGNTRQTRPASYKKTSFRNGKKSYTFFVTHCQMQANNLPLLMCGFIHNTRYPLHCGSYQNMIYVIRTCSILYPFDPNSL